MKKNVIAAIFCAFLSNSAFAALDGPWEGLGLNQVTVKVGPIRVRLFVPELNMIAIDDINKTITITNSFGTFSGVFKEKITTKFGFIVNHKFNAKFDKTELTNLVNNGLTSDLGPDFVISNLKVTVAYAKGGEFNEILGGEELHALHGIIRIKAKFRVAEATNPSRKLFSSLVLDSDFAEFRPIMMAQSQSLPSTTVDTLFLKVANSIKALFEQPGRMP